ncbi:MarR family transcriptional regulator [Rahnella sp. SAP-1]|jgi:MarR family transcriptional regulator for hemolysin|uniref:MarR family transcriptional regulator n=1 Tax=Rouxiella aceris TaxID=2703884 RepID=A0A848MCK9_9GAMM|nr:MarR family transcriptional regulator [Rouxiella aceris]NMP25425.1 MarR family transcriptional regulator [Rouxiella aceris]
MKNKATTQWAPDTLSTFWINQASRLLMKHFEQRLRPLDFGMAYLPVVIALDEQGELLQKQLAEYANVEQPTMASLLVRMERDGLVVRRPHPEDRRASYISLTSKAKNHLPRVKEQLSEVVEQASQGISAQEHDQLISLLGRIINNLDIKNG